MPKPPTPMTKRVLDMIALEMAAPDPDEAYDPPSMKLDEDEAAELPGRYADDKAEPVVVAERTLPAAIPVTRPRPSRFSLSSTESSPDFEPSLASSAGASPALEQPSTSGSSLLRPSLMPSIVNGRVASPIRWPRSGA